MPEAQPLLHNDARSNNENLRRSRSTHGDTEQAAEAAGGGRSLEFLLRARLEVLVLLRACLEALGDLLLGILIHSGLDRGHGKRHLLLWDAGVIDVVEREATLAVANRQNALVEGHQRRAVADCDVGDLVVAADAIHLPFHLRAHRAAHSDKDSKKAVRCLYKFSVQWYQMVGPDTDGASILQLQQLTSCTRRELRTAACDTPVSQSPAVVFPATPRSRVRARARVKSQSQG